MIGNSKLLLLVIGTVARGWLITPNFSLLRLKQHWCGRQQHQLLTGVSRIRQQQYTPSTTLTMSSKANGDDDNVKQQTDTNWVNFVYQYDADGKRMIRNPDPQIRTQFRNLANDNNLNSIKQFIHWYKRESKKLRISRFMVMVMGTWGDGRLELWYMVEGVYEEYCDIESKIASKQVYQIGTEQFASEVSDASTFHEKGIEQVDSKWANEEGTNNVHLVLGPSGSGKSLFALKNLPGKTPSGGNLPQGTHHTTFYWKLAQTNNDESTEEGHEKQFQSVKSKMLQAIIESHFNEIYLTEQDLPLNMSISLVIDEAAEAGDLLGNMEQLNSIYHAVGQVAEISPQLIVTGNGYDKISANLDSTEVCKHRMKDWDRHCQSKTVDRLVRDYKVRKQILDAIQSQPILRNLSTNPRTSQSCLIGSEIIWKRFSSNAVPISQFQPTIIDFVAREFIESSNGLKSLTAKERMKMARAVLREIRSGRYFHVGDQGIDFPDFSDLDPKLAACAMGLVSTNVETRNKTNYLVDESLGRTVTISPALYTLLLWQMGITGDILGKVGEKWTPQEFIALVNAFSRTILRTKSDCLGTVHAENLLQRLPEENSNVEFSCPVSYGQPVYMNSGAEEPFADVIAINKQELLDVGQFDHRNEQLEAVHLLRAKHDLNANGFPRIDLLTEFQTMGVLRESVVPHVENTSMNDEKMQKAAIRHRNGQALTSALIHCSKMQPSRKEADSAMIDEQTNTTNETSSLLQCDLYPDVLFSGGTTNSVEWLDCTFDETSGNWMMGNDLLRVYTEEFPSDSSVRVTFIIVNPKKVELITAESKAGIFLEPSHIDWEGRVVGGGAKGLLDQVEKEWLKRNVKVRFLIG